MLRDIGDLNGEFSESVRDIGDRGVCGDRGV